MSWTRIEGSEEETSDGGKTIPRLMEAGKGEDGGGARESPA